jgi:hypothetical protein
VRRGPAADHLGVGSSVRDSYQGIFGSVNSYCKEVAESTDPEEKAQVVFLHGLLVAPFTELAHWAMGVEEEPWWRVRARHLLQVL